MTFTFDDKQFLLDGKPYPMLAGAIHYFRCPPEYWRDRLLKLKECGLNTVETYVAWNWHEKTPGKFDFSGILDLGRFLDIAAELGLNAIVRPGPYICAEWEGGGLPAWLLSIPGMRIRCNNEPYKHRVRLFFEQLFKILIPRLCTNGGNVLMLQVENEYGSYGDDHDYLIWLTNLYRELGADCMLYHADGNDPYMMAAASPDKTMFAAMNYGSNPVWHEERRVSSGRPGPHLCGEYWCGWFDHWGEQHHARSASDIAYEIRTFLSLNAGFNFYMFFGGTNFGFWSGANGDPCYLPTTTSYDYDGLLNEAGDRTEKYYAVRDVIAEKYPDRVPALTAKESEKKAYESVSFVGSALLFDHLRELSSLTETSAQPMTMEETGSYYGYLLYETDLKFEIGTELDPSPIADRLSFYADRKPFGTMENGKENQKPVMPDGTKHVAILCENMGRINYGPDTLDSKGLRRVRFGFHQHMGWKNTALPMDDLSHLTFDAVQTTDEPAFHKAILHIDGTPADTWISTRGFHKGFLVVNGVNIGRYYTDSAPQKALYLPAPFLHEGDNEILVFESEKTEQTTLSFLDHPDFE